MTIGRILPISVAGLLCLGAASANAEPRAVVELFTSQGCSSCPAADKVLGELSHDSSIVALSLPVDYWDYLGWKDTLASPSYSARQRNYARQRGDRQVYTPQAVINGVVHVLGSDKAAILDAAKKGARLAMTVPIHIETGGERITVSVPDGKDGQPSGDVWICGVAKAIPVAIGRGENRGTTVTYYNVGRRWQKLGTWTGKAATWTLPASDIKVDGVDAAAAILQTGGSENPGPILGADFASLR